MESLIRDLQARKSFKIYKKQYITPVAIMTSSAKKDHENISLLFVKDKAGLEEIDLVSSFLNSLCSSY